MADLEDAARRAAQGDGRAFRTIVDATGSRLYRLSLRLAVDPDDARDVLQEAYLRAHRALLAGRFKGESSLETWLYRIVVNTALNHRRSRARRARLSEPERHSAMSPETSAEVAKVMAFVRELPPEQRAALVLKELEGCTSVEIGQLVGCSEGAVEQRLVRARETLRRRFTDG